MKRGLLIGVIVLSLLSFISAEIGCTYVEGDSIDYYEFNKVKVTAAENNIFSVSDGCLTDIAVLEVMSDGFIEAGVVTSSQLDNPNIWIIFHGFLTEC